MRKSLVVGLLIAIPGTAPVAKAQEEPAKLELYGGYDYARCVQAHRDSRCSGRVLPDEIPRRQPQSAEQLPA